MDRNHNLVTPVDIFEAETAVSDSSKTDFDSVMKRIVEEASYELPGSPFSELLKSMFEKLSTHTTTDFPVINSEGWWYQNIRSCGSFQLEDRYAELGKSPTILEAQHHSWLRNQGWTEVDISGLELLCRERRTGKTQKKIMADIEKFESTLDNGDGKMAQKKADQRAMENNDVERS